MSRTSLPREPRLRAEEVLGRLRAAGVELFVEDGALRYSAPPGALSDELRASARACRAELAALVRDEADTRDGWDFSPPEDGADGRFPLTDLQQAYLIGEKDFYDRAAPAVFLHEYGFAPEAAPDPDRLERALRLLRSAHGALRLAVFADGTQRILPDEDIDLLDRHDLSGLTGDEARRRLSELSGGLVGDLPPHEAGRPFLVRFVRLPGGAARVQLALRLTAFDGVTTQLFFEELARLCADPEYSPEAPALTFRDYVEGLRRRERTAAHKEAELYWEKRADRLPPAPDLPHAPRREPGAPSGPLRRTSLRLPAADWRRFRRHAAAAGVPVGTAVFGLFVETLHRWTDGAEGTLTVLAAHRPPVDPELASVWGNASTTVLVGYGRAEPGLSFAEHCRRLQAGLFADLSAKEVSGVAVGRLLRTRHGSSAGFAPVVFTSGLDLVDGAPAGFHLPIPGAELVRSAISTPQVLLDHQVFEEAGDLVCNFDFSAEAYPEGMVGQLAEYHAARLSLLAEDPEAWHRVERLPLPAAQLRERLDANGTAADLPGGALHSFVLEQCRLAPDAPAVIDEAGTMTYAELDRASAELAERLPGGGLVGIRLPKGRGQAVAALAVLRSGGAYLPFDARWPDARVELILRHSRAAALIDEDTLRGAPPTRYPVPPGDGLPDGTAYVIYTSGSTGSPKGVVIPHEGAVNTLRDLTGRFRLSPGDRVLAVSSLAFDLSVFDVFGMLGAGGSVVVPREAENPDPQSWGELVARHRVTVWNSVPALLDLTLEFLGDRAAEVLAPLRLVMLSGDWVPPALVDRLAEVCPSAEVIAMGGATEASIWSNWFRAAERPDDWTSVPYGLPLANQTMHVLDGRLQDAPTWVAGDLYIGGAGVALGYLRDEERTEAAFLTHPDTGERLYRTGDRARYRPGGLVEFLGRVDHQVKVGGHRIELGEIESRMTAHPAVEAAVALVDRSRGGGRLVAFATRAAGRDLDAEELRAALADQLPPYMVPSSVVELDALPLSANGKVDRKALLSLCSADPAADTASAEAAVPPGTPEEEELLRHWRELLGPSVAGVTDDFFAAGGDSLLAVRLFRRIEDSFGVRLPLATLFRNSTVRAQARMLAEAGAEAPGRTRGPLVEIRASGARQHLVLVHPVGGDILCYRDLLELLPDGADVHGLRSPGLGEGEKPAGSVDELAARYAEAIIAGVPEGPLHLLGWSMGGTVALHTAVHLERAGRPVASLTAVDAFTGRPGGGELPFGLCLAGFFTDLVGDARAASHLPETRAEGELDRIGPSRAALVEAGLLDPALSPADLARLFAVYRGNSEILRRHTPVEWTPRNPLPGVPAALAFRAARGDHRHFEGLLPLDELVPGLGPAVRLDEDHYSIVRGPAALRLAERLTELFKAASAAPTPEGSHE